MKKLMLPALALLTLGAAGCKEETPTGVGQNLLPVVPTTVELRLPWEQFATGLEVFGGFGLPSDRGSGLIARQYRGVLDSRTLGRWSFLSQGELVVDSTGTLVDDLNLSFRNGRIVIHFDTGASAPGGPVTISAHRTLEPWDARTTSWAFAVDSTGDRRPWGTAGGSPSIKIGEAVWDRSRGDSLILDVDSLALRAWADTASSARGFRLDAESEDMRVEIRSARLDYSVVPSLKRDTLIARTAAPTQLTFIYTPVPAPPSQGLRVGGIPSWRSVIHLSVAKMVNGPPEFCAAMGCPFELTAERISHAALVLETRLSDPVAFQPTDTVRVDVRPVLAPERLPKSPLGPSLSGARGALLASVLFATPRVVSIPITEFVRAQVEAVPADGIPAPKALVLLSFLEPASIAFASFTGPGASGAPYLRLILTTSPRLELP